MRWRTAAFALLFAGGCVPLVPYEELRTRLPVDELLQVDGQAVHVVRSGRGQPVVLLHGFGSSAYSWRQVTAELADEHELIAVDLNGHGFTERVGDAAAYTVAGQLALVRGVMDALDIDSAHVVGHSYGAALAVHLAWRHPERVRSLILVGSARLSYPWDRRNLAAAIRPLTYLFVRGRAIRKSAVLGGLRRAFAEDSQVSPELVDAYYERVRIEGVSRAFRGLTAPTREPRDLPVLERIDLPVLTIWGSRDELADLEEGRRTTGRMPRNRFVVLEGIGHIPLEESPEKLAELMRAFLARNGPASAPES